MRALQLKKSSNLVFGSIFTAIETTAAPVLVAQFFNAMYNWIDAFWGGRISVEAQASFTVTFPIFLFSIALGQLFASGNLALMTTAHDSGNNKQAADSLAQAAVFSFIFGILAMLCMQIFDGSLLRLLGANGEVLEYGEKYVEVLAYGFPFLILLFTLNSGFISRGNARFIRNIFIMNVLINLILNPLLLYGVSFGTVSIIPPMGIRGIALATVIVNCIGAILALIKSFREHLLPPFSLSRYFPSLRCMFGVVYLGLPTFLQIGLVSVGISVLTYFLFLVGGDNAVAAYGIGLRIEQMALIPAFAISIALSMFTRQNNEVQQYTRIRDAYRLSLLLSWVILLCAVIPLVLLSYPLARMFTGRLAVVEITELYLLFGFLTCMGHQMFGLSLGLIQGMRQLAAAVLFAVLRHVLLPLLIISLMLYVFRVGITGVFASVVINVWVCALFMRIFVLRLLRRRNAEKVV